MSAAPSLRDLRHPAVLLACGFGSGLAPKMPGTCGTLLAAAIYLFFLQSLSVGQYGFFLFATAAVGWPLCAAASRRLGEADHPAIVWDEFVGYWLAMWGAPAGWQWALAGFVLFRFFDIVKPGPIGFLEANLGGPSGVMADDLAAGLATLCCLYFFGLWL